MELEENIKDLSQKITPSKTAYGTTRKGILTEGDEDEVKSKTSIGLSLTKKKLQKENRESNLYHATKKKAEEEEE